MDRSRKVWIVGALVGALLSPVGAATAEDRESLGLTASPLHAEEPIRPIPAPPSQNPALVALGRQLFLDPILSRDGTISCASCHNLDQGGVDGRPHSLGVGGAEGTANAPTVYNAALNLAQFWDGRAASLEEQANGPIINPLEMGADWPRLLTVLSQSHYARDFQKVFGGEPSADRVRTALAAFERTLLTTNSRFDRWLAGDDKALSDDEKRGYALFKSYGCASCHQGANVGGNMFQKFGFMGNWFTDRGGIKPDDFGRFRITGREADRFVFKVPSLRLAVMTAPYFHDGSVPTLNEAIKLMGRYQLGREIPDSDIALIITFLGSLPGKMAEATP
jgi:cytochrome c peroxidase